MSFISLQLYYIYMEVRPSKKAVVVWFFEKGPFLTFICVFCLYLVMMSIDSIPYVYNSELSVITFSSVLLFLSLFSLFYEYRTKKYFILKKQVHVKNIFGVKRTDFKDIDDVRVVRTPIHRIMKVGDVLVKSKKGNLAFECIKSPEKIKKEIHDKVSKLISKEK